MEHKPIPYEDASLAVGTIRTNFDACMQPLHSLIQLMEKNEDLVGVANVAKACLNDAKSRFETLCHEAQYKFIPHIRIWPEMPEARSKPLAIVGSDVSEPVAAGREA